MREYLSISAVSCYEIRVIISFAIKQAVFDVVLEIGLKDRLLLFFTESFYAVKATKSQPDNLSIFSGMRRSIHNQFLDQLS